MKKILLLITILLSFNFVFGQLTQPPQAPQVLLPSPQVALLQNYLDYHIDEARGTAEVSIPIYEIIVDDINIPIALSYQTSGIKYKQYDGEIAAGWVLTCNYNTSREALGKPDEAYNIPSGGFNDLWLKYPNGYILDRYLASLYYDFGKSHAPAAGIDGSMYDEGLYDQFSYHLPTTSGDFIIGDRLRKTVETYSRNNDIINLNIVSTSYTSTPKIINGLDIIDDSGNIFYFGKSLTGKIEYETGGVGASLYRQHVPTMWPLMNIITKKNRRINFEYIKGQVLNYDLTQQNYTIVDASDGCHGSSPYASYAIDINRLQTQPLVMDKIDTDKEIIVFKREKYSDGTLRITAIEITDRLTNNLIKKVALVYQYKEPHYLLSSVSITDPKSTISEKYNLDYILDVSLDKLYSDQWGYYCYGRDSKYGAFASVLHKEFKEQIYRRGVNGVDEPIHYILSADNPIMDPPQYAERAFNKRADYYSLKKIVFPTGGYRTFEYESNKMGEAMNPTEGCGIRVKKIISDDGTGKKLSKTYKYGNNENGLGNVSFHLSAKQFGDESLDIILASCYPSNLAKTYTPRTVRTFSTLLKGDINLSQIYVQYDMITIYEEEYGTSNSNGKIISSFNHYPVYDILPDMGFSSQFYHDYRSNWNEGAYVHMYAKGRRKPLLKYREYYDSNRKVKEERYDYINTYGNKTFTGLKIEEKVITNSFEQADKYPDRTANIDYDPYNHTSSFFNYMTYNIELGSFLMSSKTVTEYTKNNISTDVIETYEYNTRNVLMKTTLTNSANGTLVTENKYPYNYTIAPYPEMVSKNMISPVIEQITSNNNKEIGRIKTNYSKVNGFILPSFIQTSASGIPNLHTDIVYDLYDTKGNILQYTILGSVSTSYLWAYSGQYPIAEIKNAAYVDIVGILGQSSIDRIASTSVPTDADMLAINALRKNTTTLRNALITTYTYKPLVGMLTATDPSGITTYYDYDSFGRLKETYIYKDNIVSAANKQVIQQYNYNYKTQ